MAKCSDYWCEHYDKNKGNCEKCLKSEDTKEKSSLSDILKKRAHKQMGINKKGNTNGQER
jgi:hypothetical protein